ncbi:hypothetical protein B2G88_00355 [Natronolimnobius baerhuensis]|uniref:Uncharacterized protein n=1 Tax=Natronolimnobius baerhuensis TaxID=253108 RepID=A0A202EE31_9EURY|nr:hypothetical protein B2G88_00355 [Natronolimnobius baerhuensis]
MLAALGTAMGVTAGCVDDLNGDTGNKDDAADTVAGHFDTGPERPECEVNSETIEVQRGDETREADTAATIPYPDPPTAGSEDDVLEYVEEFDHAYVTQSILCDRSQSGDVLRIGYSVDTREQFGREGIDHVFVSRAAGATHGIDDGGGEWVADLGFTGVVYAIDDTGLARTESDTVDSPDVEDIAADAPDPLEDGELVAAFE